MSPTALVLTGHVLWIFLLLTAIAALRVHASAIGGKPANSFSPDGADVSPFSNRLCRAHANCYETFPLFGGLMVLALATQSTDITDHLAPLVLIARLGQSGTHLMSTHPRAVLVRFGFLAVQMVVAGWWIVQFLTRFAFDG